MTRSHEGGSEMTPLQAAFQAFIDEAITVLGQQDGAWAFQPSYKYAPQFAQAVKRAQDVLAEEIHTTAEMPEGCKSGDTEDVPHDP